METDKSAPKRGKSLNFSQEATLPAPTLESEEIEIESEKVLTKRKSKSDFIEEESHSGSGSMEEEDDFLQTSPKATTRRVHENGEHCEVCYSTVSRKFLHGDSKDLFDLLQCRVCGIHAHKVCYGMKTHFDLQVSEKGTTLVKFFLCDHCKEGDSSVKCFICDNKEGCLRRSTDGKWFHTLCVIGSPKINIKDVTTMSVDLSGFRKNTQKVPVSRKCRICNNRVQTFGCINRNSDDHCHLNCALREKLLNPDKSEWKIYFSLADEELLKISHCVEENAIISNIRELNLSLEQVIEKTGITDASAGGSFKKLKAREAAQESKKSRGKHASEPSKYDKELYETAKNKAQANLDEGLSSQRDEEEEEEDDDVVGGRVVVIKTVDVDPEDQDLVDSDEDDDIEDDLKNVIDYSTPDSLIRVIEDLYKELSPSNNLLEVYRNNQVKVKEDLRELPKAEKLSFPEVLFFVNVFFKRAHVVLGNLCQISAIEALLKASKNLPFPLTQLIKSLNTKYFTGLALDSLLQSNIEQCRPESAYQPIKKKFDEAIIRRNTNVLDQVTEFETIYLKKPVKILTSQYEELRILRKQLSFLKKVYEDIADEFNYGGKNRSGRTTTTKASSSRHETPNKGPVIVQENFPAVPLSKISELNAKAKSSHLPDDFEEIQLLKDYVGGREGLLEIEDIHYNGGSDLSLSASPRGSPRGSPRKVFEGPKGLVKIVEVIPAAPETLKASKKGRPKNVEKNTEEIEDEHKEQLKRLLSLPTIKETEEALEKAKRGMEFRKVKVLEANLKSVEKWKEEFERAVERNDGRLGGLIERIEMVEVYVPEMKRAMELRRSWSLWQVKVNEIQRRMKKKVESLFEDTSAMVSFKDLEKVILEGENIVNLEADDSVVKKLEEKYKRIQAIREDFNNKERPDFAKLEEYKKEILEMNVKFPEISRFVATIAINENLKRDIEDKISLDKLAKKLEGSEYVSERVDPNLFEQLKEKVAEGKRIQDQAKELLKKRGSYEVQEIAKLAQLSRDLLSRKISLPEEGAIDKVVSEFLEFVTKVYEVVTENTAAEHKINHHSLLTDEYESTLKRKTINDLIESCKQSLERQTKLTLEKAREIEKAFEASEVENMKIGALREFYKSLAIPLWKIKAKGLLDAEQKTYQEIQKFINDIPPIEQVSDEDIVYLKKIQQVEKKISAWDKEVKDLLEINSKEHFIALMDEAYKNKTRQDTFQRKLDDIVDKMKKPMDQYNKEFYPYSDLDKRIRALNKAIGWVKWIGSAIEIRAQVLGEDLVKIDFEKIKEMYDKMQKFTLPDSKGLCKQIADWYRGAEKIYKEFLTQYEKKRVVLENKKGKEISENMAKLIKKNEDKISIEEAQKILEKLKKGTKEVEFPEQIQAIEQDLNELNQWSEKIQKITQKVREGLSEEVEIELEDGLEKEIEELKQRMLQLPIRDEDFERGLQILDWTYDAASLKGRSITIEILRKLIKYGEKLNIEDLDVQRLLNNLEEELTKGKGLVSFAERLEKVKTGKVAKKIPYDDLLKKREEVENSIVDLAEEKQAIEEVYQAAKELKDQVRDLFDGAVEEKVLEKDVGQLLKKVKRSPVELGAEKKKLEEALNEAEKIENEITKKKRGRDAKWISQMLQRYEDCAIYIEKAVKLLQESQDLEYNPRGEVPEENEPEPVERLTKAKAREEESSEERESPKRPPKKERVQREKKERIPKEKKEKAAPKPKKQKKTQEEEDEDKVKEFKEKAQIMERRRYGSSVGPRLKISPTELRKMQEEGERLKELFPEDERLAEMADVVREIGGVVEAQVQNIKKVKKVQDLDDLEKVGLGFVDLSYTISARRTALNKSKETAKKKKTTAAREEAASSSSSEEEESEDELKLVPKKRRERSASSVSEERGRREKERSREKESGKRASSSRSQGKKKVSTSPRPNKEKLRKELLRNIHQREYERNTLVDHLRRGEEERLAAYYGRVISEKAALKSKQVVIAVLKHLLEDCPYISLDFLDTFRAATEIYYALPELRQSRELYDTTISRLRAVLNCRYISRTLIDLNFNYTHIRNLVHQGPRARQELEKRLAEEAAAKDFGVLEDEDDFEEAALDDDFAAVIDEEVKIPKKSKPTQQLEVSEEVSEVSGEGPVLIEEPTSHSPDMIPVQVNQTDSGVIKIKPILLKPYGESKPQQIIAYNPDSPKPESLASEPYNPEIPEPKPRKPKTVRHPDVIIKIFNGALSFEQNKMSPNFDMFTNCSLDSKNRVYPDTVLRIPALDARKSTKIVQVSQWMPTDQFHNDFTQVVRYWNKQNGKIQVIAGWIGAAIASDTKYFEDLSQNMLDSDKVAVCNYFESSKLIVMNKYQMRRDWALHLNLKINEVYDNSKHLLYVIIHDPSRLHSVVPSISPILVKTLPSGAAAHEDNVSDNASDLLEEAPKPPKSILKKPTPQKDLLGKRPHEEVFTEEDETIKELENLVKKVKNGDGFAAATLVERLRFTPPEILEKLGRAVDREGRNIIINIAQNVLPAVEEEEAEKAEDDNLPRIIPREPQTTTVTGLVKDSGKFTPAKFTPQQTTGSTKASPGRLLQDNTSMKSTPVNIFGESQIYIRDPVSDRNQEAFAGLQPSSANLPIITARKPRQEFTLYASFEEDKEVFEAVRGEESKEGEQQQEGFVRLPLNWSRLGPINVILPKVTLNAESQLFAVKQSTFEKMMEYKRNRGDFGPVGGSQEPAPAQEEEEQEEGEVIQEEEEENLGQDLEDIFNSPKENQ